MPSRTAATPGAVPAGLAVIGGFPQDEVRRIALVGGDLHARAGDLVVARTAGKAAVIRHRRDAEQYMPLGLVGMALADQGIDDGDHAGDVRGRARFVIRGGAAECAPVPGEGGGGAFGQLGDGDAVGFRLGDDLVLDIGDVPYIGHLRIEMTQETDEDIEHDEGTRIADVNALIDRRAADIDTHMAGFQWLEPFLAACQRVVNLDGDGVHGVFFPTFGADG